MAAEVTWANRIPDALKTLRESTETDVRRETIEDLLGVKRRAAQQVMAVVGTYGQDKGLAAYVKRLDLILYLESQLKSQADERRREARHFAEVLARLKKEHAEMPPVLLPVQQIELERMERRQRVGNLPHGIEISPGLLVIKFDDLEALVWKLQALAIAMQNDYEEFAIRISVSPQELRDRFDPERFVEKLIRERERSAETESAAS